MSKQCNANVSCRKLTVLSKSVQTGHWQWQTSTTVKSCG